MFLPLHVTPPPPTTLHAQLGTHIKRAQASKAASIGQVSQKAPKEATPRLESKRDPIALSALATSTVLALAHV